MVKVVLIGAGGTTKIICNSLKKNINYEIVGIFDDFKEKDSYFNNLKIIDSINNIEKYKNIFDGVINCIGSIGDINGRKCIFEKLKSFNIKLINFNNSLYIDSDAKIGMGCILMNGVIINVSSTIEDNVYINTGAIIEHDCNIGESCFIGSGCTIAGNVNIGKNTFIGLGTTIIQNIKIGENCIIGAGSVVVRDIENNIKCYGTPVHKNKIYLCL